MPIACTLQSLRLSVIDAGGGSDTVTATVRVNGTVTSLTASATTTGTGSFPASDLTDTVHISAGDVVGITVTRTAGSDNYEVGTGVVCQ